MKLEYQVCSLELSKKLKELGVKQESLFCWTNNIDLEFLPSDSRNNKVCIAAFTTSELGEMLPAMINGSFLDTTKYIDISKYSTFLRTRYSNAGIISQPDTNESNTRAKLLIFLIENGHVKVDE